MKRFYALALCAACLCSCLAFAAAETGTAQIGGKAANTVTVAMHGGVSADVALAQGSISRDQSAADIVAAAKAKGELIAAVNGGYFNAYYKTQPEDGYGEAPRCQVNLIRDGMVVNGGAGDQTAVYLGFTPDGKALIDEVGVTLYVEFGGRKLPTWGVNYYYPEPDSLLLFTPEAGADLPVPANAKVAKIVGGRVTEILDFGRMTCAPDTYYFVCGKNLYDRLPAVGDAVSFRTEYDKSAWKSVTAAVSCGPWLLSGGKNVFSENSRFAYLAEQKVSETAAATRTFAAILPGGDLMLGTCNSASPKQITEYLLTLGATDAMLLDGGASSMLWANGKMLHNAGRSLNNVLCIYDSGNGAPAPGPADRPEVVLSPQKLAVNGVTKATEIYNIDGTNYFKIRDLAALLSGTGSQFNVGFDAEANAVMIATGEKYQANGGELKPGEDKSATAVPSPQGVVIDGEKVELTAYNIGGANFFGLRALQPYLGYEVGFDAATNTAKIVTK